MTKNHLRNLKPGLVFLDEREMFKLLFAETNLAMAHKQR